MTTLFRWRARCLWFGAVLVGLLALGGATHVQAQQPDEPPLNVLERAFRSGEVDGLMAHAADRIEVAVMGSGMLYSRRQAIYVMQKFFQEHPPDQFAFEDVSQAEGSWFASGTYRTQGEQSLRVYVRFRQKQGGWKLLEIRIGPRGG